MSVFFQGTQSEVPLFQQQLELESRRMTSSRLLTGVQTLSLEGFITAQCTMPHLGTQYYPPGVLTHKFSVIASLALSKARLHLVFELQTTPLICETEPSEI